MLSLDIESWSMADAGADFWEGEESTLFVFSHFYFCRKLNTLTEVGRREQS